MPARAEWRWWFRAAQKAAFGGVVEGGARFRGASRGLLRVALAGEPGGTLGSSCGGGVWHQQTPVLPPSPLSATLSQCQWWEGEGSRKLRFCESESGRHPPPSRRQPACCPPTAWCCLHDRGGRVGSYDGSSSAFRGLGSVCCRLLRPRPVPRPPALSEAPGPIQVAGGPDCWSRDLICQVLRPLEVAVWASGQSLSPLPACSALLPAEIRGRLWSVLLELPAGAGGRAFILPRPVRGLLTRLGSMESEQETGPQLVLLVGTGHGEADAWGLNGPCGFRERRGPWGRREGACWGCSRLWALAGAQGCTRPPGLWLCAC